MLDSLKQKINIKYCMVLYLTLLLLFSALMLGQPLFILKGFLIVAFYSFFDVLWTYLEYKKWYWPVSSWISGLILSLVAWPDLPWYFLLLLPLLAVFSKHVLRVGKMRQVFNPAGFSLGVCSFFVPAVAWWGQAWSDVALVIISIVGVCILWRQSRWHEFLAFSVSYVFFLVVFFLSSGILNPGQLLEIIKVTTWQGATVFFATVMLIEPMTSQFPKRIQRIWYGIFVGFFAVMLLWILKYLPLSIDPLVMALLLGNLTASLLFLPHAKK